MQPVNFAVGETFPLPIAARGDGGLFQIDASGAMFILQLSRIDVIAREAFRTGEIELALAEKDGILLLLYKIDGIFKAGWGDAPLAVHLLAPANRPTAESLAENSIHLYLVEPHLNVLLALRQAKAPLDFWQTLTEFALADAAKIAAIEANAADTQPYATDFSRRLGNIYLKYSPDDLAAAAKAKMKIPSTL